MIHAYHCDANPADTLTVERVGACLQFQARKPVNLTLRDCAELAAVCRDHIRAIHESLARANKAPATLEEVCRTLMGKRDRPGDHLSPTAMVHATELLDQGSPVYIVEEDGAQSVLDMLYESHWPAPLAGKMVAVVQHVAESRVAARRRFEAGPMVESVANLPPLRMDEKERP